VSNKTLKEVSLFGGVCTIIATVTDALSSKKWREVHTAALFGGAVATAIGLFA
jgi:hypothetical protein